MLGSVDQQEGQLFSTLARHSCRPARPPGGSVDSDVLPLQSVRTCKRLKSDSSRTGFSRLRTQSGAYILEVLSVKRLLHLIFKEGGGQTSTITLSLLHDSRTRPREVCTRKESQCAKKILAQDPDASSDTETSSSIVVEGFDLIQHGISSGLHRHLPEPTCSSSLKGENDSRGCDGDVSRFVPGSVVGCVRLLLVLSRNPGGAELKLKPATTHGLACGYCRTCPRRLHTGNAWKEMSFFPRRPKTVRTTCGKNRKEASYFPRSDGQEEKRNCKVRGLTVKWKFPRKFCKSAR